MFRSSSEELSGNVLLQQIYKQLDRTLMCTITPPIPLVCPTRNGSPKYLRCLKKPYRRANYCTQFIRKEHKLTHTDLTRDFFILQIMDNVRFRVYTSIVPASQEELHSSLLKEVHAVGSCSYQLLSLSISCRQTDGRQAGRRQTGRQTDRQTDGQTIKTNKPGKRTKQANQTDRQTDRRTIQTDRQAKVKTRQTDQTDKQDRQTDRLTDKPNKHRQTSKQDN